MWFNWPFARPGHMVQNYTYTGEQVAQWDFQNNAPALVLVACVAGVRRWRKEERRAREAREDRFPLPPALLLPALILTSLSFYGLPRRLLFWKSHCATCSPVYVILYHVTGLCKGLIFIKSQPGVITLNNTLTTGTLIVIMFNITFRGIKRHSGFRILSSNQFFLC